MNDFINELTENSTNDTMNKNIQSQTKKNQRELLEGVLTKISCKEKKSVKKLFGNRQE